MSAYVTLTEGAFNDESVIGRTVRVETIEVEDNYGDLRPFVVFGFTWAENPHDMDTVAATFCRTATEDEIRQAERDYANEGARFV